LTAPDGILAGTVDLERIGVTGYSAGGFTAMLAGGARRNSEEKRAWCATDEAKNSWVGPLLCVDEDARDREWASLLGMEAPPDGLWPDVGDPRVDAIVPVDGGAFDFGPEGLNQIRVPALLIFARGAPMAMPYPHDRLLESMTGTSEAIAIFEYADHPLFMHTCNEGMISLETIAICAEPVWDKLRAHDLFHHLATAFLLATLKDDEEAAAALAPDAVAFPGITYEAQGF
jgi:predicted dienelactone hydrolase